MLLFLFLKGETRKIIKLTPKNSILFLLCPKNVKYIVYVVAVSGNECLTF